MMHRGSMSLSGEAYVDPKLSHQFIQRQKDKWPLNFSLLICAMVDMTCHGLTDRKRPTLNLVLLCNFHSRQMDSVHSDLLWRGIHYSAHITSRLLAR